MIRKAIFAFAILCLPAVPHADPNAGVHAYERGDFAAAYRIWKPEAENGNADLQFKLGVMNEWGMGGAPDYREAVKWYRRAAEQGHAEAQFTLGFMYGSGQGVPQNDVQAYAWYELAAANGHKSAREFRDATAKRLERRQIDEALRLAQLLERQIHDQCAKSNKAKRNC